MHYAQTQPPAALADIVRCAWELRGTASPGGIGAADPAFPDGSPELIVNLGDPFVHVPPKGPSRRQPLAFLVGQITRPFAVCPTGEIDLVALRFEAHGAGLLHRPMSALTDGWLPLASSSGASMRALRTRLRGTARDERVQALFAILGELRAVRPEPDPRVAAMVLRMRASHGGASLEALTREMGVTSRTVQRLFAEQVGISPKLLARIMRFQRVFEAMRSEPASLARVAVECGYYDQPHLVRDFRDFAGEAPARTLAAMPEFTAFFTAQSRFA